MCVVLRSVLLYPNPEEVLLTHREESLRMKQCTLLLLFLLGCPPFKTSPVPEPVYSTTCKNAEATLLALKCRDSKGALLGGPTKRGKPYADFCIETMSNGIDLNPGCYAAAKTCEEALSCPLP